MTINKKQLRNGLTQNSDYWLSIRLNIQVNKFCIFLSLLKHGLLKSGRIYSHFWTKQVNAVSRSSELMIWCWQTQHVEPIWLFEAFLRTFCWGRKEIAKHQDLLHVCGTDTVLEVRRDLQLLLDSHSFAGTTRRLAWNPGHDAPRRRKVAKGWSI